MGHKERMQLYAADISGWFLPLLYCLKECVQLDSPHNIRIESLASLFCLKEYLPFLFPTVFLLCLDQSTLKSFVPLPLCLDSCMTVTCDLTAQTLVLPAGIEPLVLWAPPGVANPKPEECIAVDSMLVRQ